MPIDIGGLGGVLLILGAFALYKGKLMYSVGLYFFADIMWLILAYKSGDTLGAILIMIGMILGVGVYLKAQKGIFHKDLKKE